MFVPGLRGLLYTLTLPFRHVGIFVHEMGHGLFTLLSGGSFHFFRMEIMRGGVAYTSGGLRMATLLGGLLGPALAGALLLQVSTRARKLNLALILLGLFFVSGVYYMSKPLFLSSTTYPSLRDWGIGDMVAVVIPLGGAIITFLLLRFGELYQRLYLQVLGILMCYSGYSDVGYIFRFQQLDNGLYSDARVFAGLFWGGPESVPFWLFVITSTGITVVNFALMGWGVHRAFRD